jgi:hypothetical protein
MHARKPTNHKPTKQTNRRYGRSSSGGYGSRLGGGSRFGGGGGSRCEGGSGGSRFGGGASGGSRLGNNTDEEQGGYKSRRQYGSEEFGGEEDGEEKASRADEADKWRSAKKTQSTSSYGGGGSRFGGGGGGSRFGGGGGASASSSRFPALDGDAPPSGGSSFGGGGGSSRHGGASSGTGYIARRFGAEEAAAANAEGGDDDGPSRADEQDKWRSSKKYVAPEDDNTPEFGRSDNTDDWRTFGKKTQPQPQQRESRFGRSDGAGNWGSNKSAEDGGNKNSATTWGRQDARPAHLRRFGKNKAAAAATDNKEADSKAADTTTATTETEAAAPAKREVSQRWQKPAAKKVEAAPKMTAAEAKAAGRAAFLKRQAAEAEARAAAIAKRAADKAAIAEAQPRQPAAVVAKQQAAAAVQQQQQQQSQAAVQPTATATATAEPAAAAPKPFVAEELVKEDAWDDDAVTAAQPKVVDGMVDVSVKNAKLFAAIVALTEVSRVDLAKGFPLFDVKDAAAYENLKKILCKSVVSQSSDLDLHSLYNTLNATQPTLSRELLVSTLVGVRDLKGKPFVQELVEESKLDVLALVAGEDELADALAKFDLLCLKPATEMKVDIAALLASGTSPADALKQLNASLPATESAAHLAEAILSQVASTVFADKKTPAVEYVATAGPLLVRVVGTEEQAQVDALFAFQSAWYAAGKHKTAIKAVFKSLHDSKVVTPASVIAWRDDKKSKAKGKMQALMKVMSWVSDIEPKPEQEEYYESDNEEEGDGMDAW